MRRRLVIIMLVGGLALTLGCRKDPSPNDPEPSGPKAPGSAAETNVAPLRKEIVAQNVLAAQLAAHYEVEGKTTFGATEPIDASLYLTSSARVEPRRISAFLVREETIIEEHSVPIAAGEARQEFDFRFSKAPRPLGAYQIRFVEIARSNGKPVLLARLFLKIE